MPQIETVKGPIDVDALGPTLMHEHVFVLSTDYAQNYGPGQWWDEHERVEHAIGRLRSLHAKGVTSIADPTVVGLGRYIPRMKRIAEQVPVNIIAATGVYTYGDLPFPYANRGPGSMFGGDEPMVADFVRDISEGIADTGVKAGFLKCAVEHADVSPGVERVLRAVAKAHVATGAPITVHTSSPECTGRYVVKVLTEEGADLTKVVIGHAGDSNDLDYLMELADTGALIGMDRFGIDLFNSTPERINTIVALASRGYADRMVLAHDASCWIDWFGPDVLAMQAALTPNWHYEHISDDVLPALAEAGVTAEQIDEMMVGNPRRYFSS
jgi:phosphotriesterase-related protein